MSRATCLRGLYLSLLLVLSPALCDSETVLKREPAGSDGKASASEAGYGEISKAEPESEMILIPGGEFVMGTGDDEEDAPIHEVYIDTFYMDPCEVTNAQYLEFCEATERPLPEFWGWDRFRCGPDYPDHPVVGVSWRDAKDYAEWRGKRLPTEAEWEYAARGGLEGKKYPHGDTVDSTTANYFRRGISEEQVLRRGTMPVGSFPPNGFGLYDMAGNVVEWVSDYYGWDYYNEGPYENPQGPEKGKFRVIRGGGWHSGPYCNRVYFRSGLRSNWLDFNVGFRCAKNYSE